MAGAIRNPYFELDPTAAGNTIEMICWHLDRYDRQRASTSSRAAVALSAGAIILAGDTIVLSRFLEAPIRSLDWRIVLFLLSFGVLTASLVMLSLYRSTGVLVTRRGSRATFLQLEDAPISLVFNGGDTLKKAQTFEAFKAMLSAQSMQDILQAAQVELWICIQQHRYRYHQLRLAVRLLRYASISLLLGMALVLAAEIFLAGNVLA